MFLEISERKHVATEKILWGDFYMSCFHKDFWNFDKQRRAGKEFESGKDQEQYQEMRDVQIW